MLGVCVWALVLDPSDRARVVNEAVRAIGRERLWCGSPRTPLVPLAQSCLVERLSGMRDDNPLAVYSLGRHAGGPGWDGRRVWGVHYTETDGALRVEGFAHDGSDVAEFANRLRLCSHFYDVTLLTGKRQLDARTNMEVVAFALELRVAVARDVAR